ncbi:hypothetical protein Barb4_01167 [Bacteroidales bacterium Barb4]|nr:hypothetical protein Barb4_01167 [Bacteroidales bacterium Barb4]
MTNLKLTSLHQNREKNILFRVDMYAFQEDGIHVIYCPALDLSAYENTEDAAKKAFEGILDENINYWMNKGTLYDDLEEHGWQVKGKSRRQIKAPSRAYMMEKNEALRDITQNKKYIEYSMDVCFPETA